MADPAMRVLRLALLAALLPFSAMAAGETLGRNVAGLLDYARDNNPEFAAMRSEADAAGERGEIAGALPDPKLRTEWRDITRGGEQTATLSPSRVGSTKYTVTQDLPWFGKRDLKREIADLDAEGARERARGVWVDLATRIKAVHAQRYYLQRNAELTREILDLIQRLEKLTQARYAGGLAAQQDVIRAQVEETGLRNELIGLDSERRRLDVRLNGLLARSSAAPLVAAESLPALPPPARLDPAALEDRLRARNPQVFAEQARVQAAEKSRELAYRNRYPDFTLGVSPIQVQSAVKEWELMVELNIPLQQGARRAQEREAESMLAAARSRKEAALNQALAELGENLSGIDAARRTAALIATSLLPQAELTLQAALAGYENGKVDFATLLDAHKQIRLARQNAIRAEVEAQLRLSEIEKLLGDEL